MAKRLNISFKENEIELELFNRINNKMDKSAFIKEVLREYFENRKQEKKNSNNFDCDSIMDILR